MLSEQHGKSQIINIVLYIMSVGLFTMIHGLQKLMVEEYSALSILFFRFCFGLFPTMLAVSRIPRSNLILNGIWLSILQAACLLGAMILAILSLAHMPLADATSLFRTAPLMMIIASKLFLREKGDLFDLFAILFGIIGTLIAMRPQMEVSYLYGFLALLSAAMYASSIACSRVLAQANSAIIVAAYNNLIILLILAPFNLPLSTIPDSRDLFIFLIIGGLSWTGQFLSTFALRNLRLAVSSSFEYTSILWAIIIGYIIWGEIPELHVILGASIITVAGTLVLFRATYERRAVQPRR